VLLDFWAADDGLLDAVANAMILGGEGQFYCLSLADQSLQATTLVDQDVLVGVFEDVDQGVGGIPAAEGDAVDLNDFFNGNG